MKKSLIAVAALVATGAFAQSSVTLYGVADVNYGFYKVTPIEGGASAKSNGMSSGGLSGSRWGLRGVEDLGGGVKAVFTYEAPVTLNNGGGNNSFARQSFLALAGGFGTVAFGRQYTPTYLTIQNTTADSLSTFDTAELLPNLTRQSNAIAYISPSFSGFTAVGAVIAEKNTASDMIGVIPGTPTVANLATGVVTAGTPNSAGKFNAIDVALFYDNGPLSVKGALGQWQLKTGANVEVAKVQHYVIGATYDFTAAKLYGNYIFAKNKTLNVKFKEFNVGVTVPFGAASLVAELGRDDFGGAKGTDFMVGANYALSKRTDMYVRAIGNKYSINNMAGAATGAAGSVDYKKQGFAFGLRHTF